MTGGRRALLLRAAVPGAALLVFAGFALLWLGGRHGAYFAILGFFGVDPFRTPFLDTHAILAAAECHHRGFDVYLYNPCDVLLRAHAQSPFWLSIVPAPVGAAETGPIGLALDLAFIASFGALFRPRSLAEAAVALLAVLSPAMIYAVERANSDIVVFLLILAGMLLSERSRVLRFCAYALFLAAGFFKYYPFALLATVARERGRDLAAALLGAALAVLAFALCYRGALREAFANIPISSYFDASFWAMNLPYALADGARASPSLHAIVVLSLLAALLAAFATRLWFATGELTGARIDWHGPQRRCLAAAAILVPFCFFASQSNMYRAMFLLLAIPGLLELRRAGEPALRRRASQVVALILFLLWGQLFQHVLPVAGPQAGVPAMLPRIAFWLARELGWWWLAAELLALALCYFRGLPSIRDLLGRIGRPRAAPARQTPSPARLKSEGNA